MKKIETSIQSSWLNVFVLSVFLLAEESTFHDYSFKSLSFKNCCFKCLKNIGIYRLIDILLVITVKFEHLLVSYFVL